MLGREGSLRRQKKMNEKFCPECGEIILAKAEICPKCGCRQPPMFSGKASELAQAFDQSFPKSRTTAVVLAIFLGGIGAHRFYLRKPVSGVFYALMVWTFIPGLLGFIEGIHYLTMSDAEFQARHVSGTLGFFRGNYNREQKAVRMHVKCPDCRELIPSDARVCSKCGCRLVPQG